MARAANSPAATTGILYCPMCRAYRQGASLLKHCMDVHHGAAPLIVMDIADYKSAVALLRKNKIKIDTLSADR